MGPDGSELYHPERKERAEGLAALPESYDEIPKPVPELGAPLPGEFGRPILRREAELGIDNSAGLRPNFVPSAEDMQLTPGMSVTVEVKTGKRRVIEYILTPLLRYRDEAIRER